MKRKRLEVGELGMKRLPRVTETVRGERSKLLIKVVIEEQEDEEP